MKLTFSNILNSLSRLKMVALCLALTLPVSAANAQDRLSAQPGGADAIARFLMNFGRFIDWPESAFNGTNEFRVCVMGENHLGRSLDRTLGSRSVGDRTFNVIELGGGDIAQARTCQIVYISSSEGARVGEITSALNGTPVLTVGEVADFPESGGMIGFSAGRGNDIAMRMHSALIAESGLNVREQLHRAIR